MTSSTATTPSPSTAATPSPSAATTPSALASTAPSSAAAPSPPCYLQPARSRFTIAAGVPASNFYHALALSEAGDRLRVDVRSNASASGEGFDFVAEWDSDGGACTLHAMLGYENFSAAGGLTWSGARTAGTEAAHRRYIGSAVAGSPWQLGGEVVHTPAQLAPECPLCVQGDEPGRWCNGSYLPWRCRWRNFYRNSATDTCLARWRGPDGSSPAPALYTARARAPAAGQLKLAFVGASTMSMFAYAVTNALGGDPGLRDAQAKEEEKKIRNRVPSEVLLSGEYTGALTLKTWDGGPEVFLAPASADEYWLVPQRALQGWSRFAELDVVVFNAVLDFACNPFKANVRSATELVAFLTTVHELWLNGTRHLAHPPALIWRSASQLRPPTAEESVVKNPCPNHAFPLLPEYTRVSNVFWRSVGVPVLDQYAVTAWAEQWPPDGLHLYPGSPAQDESANIFLNLLCNALPGRLGSNQRENHKTR